MVQQIDYQYAPIPKKLMYCLDRNCRSLLFALVDLADYFKSNRFYRSNEDLQKDTDLSKNLVIATLDTLYQNGLVDVECVGKGVGRQTNIITLNTYKFKEWEKYTFEEVRKLPELKIDTVKYKGSGYKASYLNKNKVEVSCYSNSQEISQSSSQQVLQKVNTIEETQETQSSKENNISKEIKNDLQKVNTCKEEKLPTCTIDIVEEEKSFKEFEEESFKDMKDSFNIVSTRVNLNEELTTKGFMCCSNFVNTYQNLDYQLLLKNPQQFLSNNEIKLGCLSNTITSSTGVYFSKGNTTQLLTDYVRIMMDREYQERTQQA